MHGTIKVRKWGNSLGIVIPHFVAQEMKIRAGSYLRMTYDETNIHLKTGPTDKERLDEYITELLLENKRFIAGEDTGRTEDDILKE